MAGKTEHSTRTAVLKPDSTASELARLANHEDADIRAGVAAHPNTPAELLGELAAEFPSEVMSNLALPLLRLAHPNLLKDWPDAALLALLRLPQAPDWLRARLKLSDGCRVLHMICMHYSDGIPYQYEDRWINLDLLPNAAKMDFADVGPNEWLVATIPFSDAEISLQATEADVELAEHLDCTKGDALFQAERTTWWEGKAITFVRLTFRRGHRMTTRY